MSAGKSKNLIPVCGLLRLLPIAMRSLLEDMIQPDPLYRIDARNANQHKALADDLQMDMSTPPFVRTAASLPVESRERKQVPREKREQKRSQALQAETGAKFIDSRNAVEPMPTLVTSTKAAKTPAEQSLVPEATTGPVTQSKEVNVKENRHHIRAEESRRNPHLVATSRAAVEICPKATADETSIGINSAPYDSPKPESRVGVAPSELRTVDNTGKRQKSSGSCSIIYVKL